MKTYKQERFCEEYILSGGNSAAAARNAGYSASSANVTGSKLLRQPEIRQAIDAKIESVANEKIAESQEILEFLTAVMRGQSTEIFVTNSGKAIEIPANVATRLRAAETLCKIYGMFKRSDDEPKETGAQLLVTTLEKVWQKDSAESAQI